MSATLYPFFEYLVEGWQVDNEVDDYVDFESYNRDQATTLVLENYIDHMVWSEVPTNLTEMPAHTRFMFTYNDVSVYYCYGADHYLFIDNTYEG